MDNLQTISGFKSLETIDGWINIVVRLSPTLCMILLCPTNFVIKLCAEPTKFKEN